MTQKSYNGFAIALLAAFLWAVVGLLTVLGFRQDPALSSFAGTFFRVIVNLSFVLFVHAFLRKKKGLPWGDRSSPLWLWGALGALTITTYFMSVQSLGVGEATLLQGVQGIVVALLAPRFLKQSTSWLSFLAILLGFMGLALLVGGGKSGNYEGKALALASGIFAGLAYLVLSKERNKHSPEIISFYWCLVSLLAVTTLLLYGNVPLPQQTLTVLPLLAGGIVASIAQWLTTVAYQKAPAVYVSATTYLIPVFCLVGEAVFFRKTISPQTIMASALILGSGILLPILGMQKSEPRMEEQA